MNCKEYESILQQAKNNINGTVYKNGYATQSVNNWLCKEKECLMQRIIEVNAGRLEDEGETFKMVEVWNYVFENDIDINAFPKQITAKHLITPFGTSAELQINGVPFMSLIPSNVRFGYPVFEYIEYGGMPTSRVIATYLEAHLSQKIIDIYRKDSHLHTTHPNYKIYIHGETRIKFKHSKKGIEVSVPPFNSKTVYDILKSIT